MPPRPTYRQRRKARKKYGEITGLRTWRLGIVFVLGFLFPWMALDSNIIARASGEGIPTELAMVLAIAWFVAIFAWMYGRWVMRKVRAMTEEQA